MAKRRKGRPDVAKNKAKRAETEFADEQQIGYYHTTEHKPKPNINPETYWVLPSLRFPVSIILSAIVSIDQGCRPAVHAFPTMGCGPRAMGVQGIT